jgi:poly(3-hydroxybutyrate) depolymerase
MKYPFVPILALAMLLLPGWAAAKEFTKETLVSGGKSRSYYLFVPKTLKPETPAPLLFLLHGSDRNGSSLVEKWVKLAKEQGIILVGPDALNPAQWYAKDDKPELFNDLVEELRKKYPVHPRRIYLFGHSAGACYALQLALFESEFFAGTAVHAGALQPADLALTYLATRKMPISILVGTEDNFFPLARVRATRDALTAKGFTVELTEMPRHDHWYYDLAPKINRMAWDFLKQHELPADPRFEPRKFAE